MPGIWEEAFLINQGICVRIDAPNLKTNSFGQKQGMRSLKPVPDNTGLPIMGIGTAGFRDRNVYCLLLTHSGRNDHLKYLPMEAFVSFNAN